MTADFVTSACLLTVKDDVHTLSLVVFAGGRSGQGHECLRRGIFPPHEKFVLVLSSNEMENVVDFAGNVWNHKNCSTVVSCPFGSTSLTLIAVNLGLKSRHLESASSQPKKKLSALQSTLALQRQPSQFSQS